MRAWLPLLEAMACGAPAIASRVAALPEVGGDVPAWIDDPDDVDQWAFTFRRLAGRRTTSPRSARAGRRRPASVTWERCARLTLDVFRNADRDAPLHVGVDARDLATDWRGVSRARAGGAAQFFPARRCVRHAGRAGALRHARAARRRRRLASVERHVLRGARAVGGDVSRRGAVPVSGARRTQARTNRIRGCGRPRPRKRFSRTRILRLPRSNAYWASRRRSRP